MNVMRFRKKPVVIEAFQFKYSKEGIAELKEFCGDDLVALGKDRHPSAKGWAHIATLEDGVLQREVKHVATEGDWIIKGIQGEFYPCKPDIFIKTYEKVE